MKNSKEQIDLRQYHQGLVQNLKNELVGNTERIRIKKKTISNLFRYSGKKEESGFRPVDLSNFNKVLHVDTEHKTLEVQGLATYESIVDATLKYGLIPTVVPELKHITIGGASVGIGIESTCHRYGFVHDGILEADVLLSNGSIVCCSPTNEYSDLFYGLPNSYGTLGYILRVKIRLYDSKPYVTLHTKRLDSVESFIHNLVVSVKNPVSDYIETLIYSKDELYLTIGSLTGNISDANLSSIYGKTIFYKELRREGEVTLPIKEYLFRYDPEMFWNIPEKFLFNIFRAYAPKILRNSAFYSRYTGWKGRFFSWIPTKQDSKERLIQDWEVPWECAGRFLLFALETVDLDGKPWIATAINTPAKATSYPMDRDTTYFNLGFYGSVKKIQGQEPFYTTKVMDEFCFNCGGIKMLYSTSFMDKPTFDRIYGGREYRKVKEKYDATYILPTLFEKTVQGI